MNNFPLFFGIIFAITMVLLMGLFRVLLPIKNTDYKTTKTLKELSQKYFFLNLKYTVVSLACTVILGFIILNIEQILLTIKFSYLAEQEVSKSFILIPPDIYLLYITAGFIGLLLSGFIYWYLIKKELKEDLTEYLTYNNLLYKFDYLKLNKYGFSIFSVIVLSLIIILFDTYSFFGNKKIEINPILSIGAKSYLYTDVKEIDDVKLVKAPNGDVFEDPHFVIKFNDGLVWNSRVDGYAEYTKDIAIINLVSSKTNIQPQKIDFEK